MKRLILIAALACLPAFGANAAGMMECEPLDKAKWLSEEALTKKLTAEGWSVRRMKEDGGCWEFYGTDPEGRRVEAYFHPASGKKLLVNQRGNILFRAN